MAISTYENKEYGIESQVSAVWGHENMIGYSVTLRDIDADMVLDTVRIFSNESDANDYARHLVA